MRLLMHVIVFAWVSITVTGQTKTIKLNSFIDTDKAEKLWPYSSNSGRLFYNNLGVLLLNNEIIYFDKKREEVVTTVKIFPQKRYSMVPISIAISQETYICLFSNPAVGRYRIGVFDNKSNNLLVKKEHHQRGGGGIKVVTSLGGLDFFAIGPHISGYERYLDLYDENTMNPSQYSIHKFKSFYEDNTAYVLWKYDEKLNTTDSADAIERSGENLESFLMLYEKQAVDIDKEDTIYLIHSAKNYLFRTYSTSLQLNSEFKGENRNFKCLPDMLDKKTSEKLRATAGSYSVPYALYSIDDYLVSSFYQNAKGWETPTGPYFYDIYSKTGLKHGSGTVPFPFFGRDDLGGMYLYVKIPSDSWFGDDEYYFVEISIEELLEGRVDKRFVLNKIRAEEG